MVRDDIKVSIIVPCFNNEKFILSTLASIQKQTHHNWEALVVDDHSTDRTVSLIRSVQDNRIKLVQNDKNMGAAYSRNRAISMAEGEYIAFLDGDDLWHADKIEKQLDFMVSNRFDFTCTYYDVIDENGNSMGFYYAAPKKITFKRMIRANYLGCLTVMYKKSLYPGLSIPDSITKRNDYALWIKLSGKSTCFPLPECLASYRKHDGSLSSSRKSDLFLAHKRMFKTMFGFGPFKSTYFAIRNLFYIFAKKVFYKRRLLPKK